MISMCLILMWNYVKFKLLIWCFTYIYSIFSSKLLECVTSIIGSSSNFLVYLRAHKRYSINSVYSVCVVCICRCACVLCMCVGGEEKKRERAGVKMLMNPFWNKVYILNYFSNIEIIHVFLNNLKFYKYPKNYILNSSKYFGISAWIYKSYYYEIESYITIF